MEQKSILVCERPPPFRFCIMTKEMFFKEILLGWDVVLNSAWDVVSNSARDVVLNSARDVVLNSSRDVVLNSSRTLY
ncbi:hypothetical protein CEXT_415311 [Caerostris extrusa]|uniref:Uncharacterized protein n=1 Tax=Caerostris extrusa TaxID=172846 RepID=A0AAV4MU90_CAEEX|nr:hypothetical protein CEXT_415311 [Caerostris extrusa]